MTASDPQPPTPALLERLKAVTGIKGVVDDPGEQDPYLRDWRGLYRGRTPLLLKPQSTQEVSQIVRHCAQARVALVPQGGNTGLVGGSVPDASGTQILVAMGRMNRIRAIDALNYTMTVEAGCILKDVQDAATASDRLFPLSLAAEGRCQIGGVVSTNAGGTAVLRYGSMRDLVLGLEAVLPDGRVWHGLRGLRKDNTGYDLKQLFIGAEGTLGIVTAAVLKLFPRPCATVTGFAAVADPAAAIALLARFRAASADAVTSFELIPRIAIDFALRYIAGVADPVPGPHPWYVLVELASAAPRLDLRGLAEEVLAEALEAGLVGDATLADSNEQARRLWHLREAIVEAQRHAGASIKHDVAVPLSAIPDFLAQASAAVAAAIPGVRVMAFGHVGDGNIHFNLTQPEGADAAAFLGRWGEANRIVHDIVAAQGGSISAEHGVGRLKVEEIGRIKAPLEIELMRRIKDALDPLGIMNPGKVVGPEPSATHHTASNVAAS